MIDSSSPRGLLVQYSLRALLLVTTVCALATWLVVRIASVADESWPDILAAVVVGVLFGFAICAMKALVGLGRANLVLVVMIVLLSVAFARHFFSFAGGLACGVGVWFAGQSILAGLGVVADIWVVRNDADQ